ncbi:MULTISPECIES: amino acid ABC transporter permease [Chelativorans]|uniref:amino acid ABC transporter permease n=1 Tax=Chelativorans TaxID=449972 RepID=UPI00003A29CF
MTDFSESGEARRPRLDEKRSFGAGAAPKDSRGWSATAMVCALFIILAAWATFQAAGQHAAAFGLGGTVSSLLFWVPVFCAALLLWPAIKSVTRGQKARDAVAAHDLITARIETASALNYAHYTVGFAALFVVVIALAQFLMANNLAVSRTFLSVPLLDLSFPLILKAFWVNIYIFVVAEICVLVWGLIVAVARLIPGKTAAPIRAIATLYTDIFRGMPAIITIYLIGFGLPLSGLPILKDLSVETYAIIALTLTFGAYVAEVYRAGIESIHWSQVAAARSLGLTYMQTMRYVIVPQAVRRIVPPLLNDFIGLQKDTALVNVIGSIDAFNQAKILSSNYFNLSPVTVVAFLFVVITIPQARFVDRILEREQRRTRAG